MTGIVPPNFVQIHKVQWFLRERQVHPKVPTRDVDIPTVGAHMNMALTLKEESNPPPPQVAIIDVK